MRASAGVALLAVWALACAEGRGDDRTKAPAAEPDPGFLEFLGSVDRLAEVNPDYLKQADRPPAARLAAKSRVPPRPPAKTPSGGEKQ